jgi:hypothetical protein
VAEPKEEMLVIPDAGDDANDLSPALSHLATLTSGLGLTAGFDGGLVLLEDPR